MTDIIKHPIYRKTGGYTILEILIALVILAIGLFALAGLQVFSLKTNSSAYHRSVASWVAYDIIERIRSNPTKAMNYACALGDHQAVDLTKDCQGVTAQCTPAELTVYDLEVWKKMIKQELVSGDGSVTVSNSTTPPTITVSITWTDRDSAGKEVASETFTFATLL